MPLTERRASGQNATSHFLYGKWRNTVISYMGSVIKPGLLPPNLETSFPETYRPFLLKRNVSFRRDEALLRS